jgi:hypothetical protein
MPNPQRYQDLARKSLMGMTRSDARLPVDRAGWSGLRATSSTAHECLHYRSGLVLVQMPVSIDITHGSGVLLGRLIFLPELVALINQRPLRHAL